MKSEKEKNKMLNSLFRELDSGKCSKKDFIRNMDENLGLKPNERLERVLSDTKLQFKDVVKVFCFTI